MKKTIWLYLIFLAPMAVSAQDTKAGAILDAMSKRFKSLTSFRANFTYSTEGTGIKESMKGDVTVKGGKYRLKLAGQDMYNNGQTVTTFVKETNEATVTKYDPAENDALNPAKIYSIYKKGYKYTFVEEQKASGVLYEVIELTPENKVAQVKTIRITVDKKDKSVKNWKITNKDGKKTVFKVDKFMPNPAGVDDKYFSFDKSKYPGVELVDLQ